jgi:hypothetical protein
LGMTINESKSMFGGNMWGFWQYYP